MCRSEHIIPLEPEPYFHDKTEQLRYSIDYFEINVDYYARLPLTRNNHMSVTLLCHGRSEWTYTVLALMERYEQ